MGLKSSSGGGEIVQVQGGHIIRATGRKDRHSKVFTAKGPRDRRVRLSAHTAIQFYDVQDRLGYDRPSKAVDWLINKAKASIDKLAELPPWDPIAATSGNNNNNSLAAVDTDLRGANNNSNPINSIGGDHSQFYVPHCVDSQSLADSIKSFFPTNNTSEENSISFQNYPHELMSRGSSLNQDLCLSLHTLQDPGSSGSAHQGHSSHDHDHTLFQASGNMGFDGGWGQQQDMGRFTRLMGWAGDSGSGGSGGGGEGNRGGMLFSNNNNNSSQLSSTQALLLSQHAASTTAAYNSQRGTLQSSYSPLIRAFEDHPHNQQAHNHHNHNHNQHHSVSSLGHGSDNSFMGFYIPSQIHHGDHHMNGGGAASMSNRASSSSLSPDSSTH